MFIGSVNRNVAFSAEDRSVLFTEEKSPPLLKPIVTNTGRFMFPGNLVLDEMYKRVERTYPTNIAERRFFVIWAEKREAVVLAG